LFVNIVTKGKTTQVAQLDLHDLFLLGTKAKPPVLVLQMNKNDVLIFGKLKKRRLLPFFNGRRNLGICDENRILTFVIFPF